MPTLKKAEAHQIILDLYRQYHRREYLHLDPLVILREHLSTPHIEWIALLGALFAFGGVKQIQRSLFEVLRRLRGLESLEDGDRLRQALQGFKHRIYHGDDVATLLALYRESRKRFGSLQAHFEFHWRETDPYIDSALTGVIHDYVDWQNEMNFKVGPHFRHLLNSPSGGGACKRWFMYLKWMVRADDGIDLGCWSHGKIRCDQLLIPLDVHLHRISKRLKLTRLKSANLKASIEVTESLKALDPRDPIKFDFALCRDGMIESKKNRRNTHEPQNKSRRQTRP